MKTKITLLLLSIICCSVKNVSAFTVTLTGSQPSPLCQYASVDFSAIINDINNYSKTAVWKVDGVVIYTTTPNTANLYFQFPNPGSLNYGFSAAGIHQVWCEVSSPSYNSGNPVFSDTLTYSVTQNEPPSVAITDVANSAAICVGTLNVFTATPFDAGTPTYNWYVDANPPVSGTNIFNYVPATAGVHVVFCVVRSSQACDSLPPVSLPEAYSNTIIVNVDSCTIGIEKINTVENSVFLSPNPATSEIRIQSSEFKVQSVEMYNTLGERVLKSEINNRQTSIDIHALPCGIYFVKVLAGEKMVVKKVMKM